MSACYTDLGDEGERESGWYDGEWKWEAIRGNAEWIVQLHSSDDRLVPVAEGRQVAQWLHSEFIEQRGKGHYLRSQYPTVIVETLERKRKEEAEPKEKHHITGGVRNAATTADNGTTDESSHNP